MKQDSFLNNIANKMSIIKITFGTNKEVKPNDYCYWDDDYYGLGQWVETDDHFRIRLLELMNEKGTK